jgi:hypothetical protein
VLPLIKDVAAEGVHMGVSDAVREAVEKVAELVAERPEGISLRELAEALRIDKSSASRRVRTARREDYLRNLEERRGQPMRLVVGDPLPEIADLLPSPESVLHCCACCTGSEDDAAELDVDNGFGSTEPMARQLLNQDTA